MKRFSRKKLWSVLLCVLGICLMLVCTLAVVLYQLGYYNIELVRRTDGMTAAEAMHRIEKEEGPEKPKVSFWSRLSEDLTELFSVNRQLYNGSYETGTEPAETDPPMVDPPTTTYPSEVYGDDPISAEIFDEATAKIRTCEELGRDGWNFDSGRYTVGKSELARAEVSSDLPDVYSYMSDKITVGGTLAAPALRPYMGYLLIDDRETLTILDGDGKLIAAGVDNLQPANARDMEGHALFTDGAGNYYYMIDGTDTMQKVTYDENFSAPLSFDYPASYAENKSGLYRYYIETQEQRRFSGYGSDITYSVEENVRRSNAAGGSYYSGYYLPYYVLRLVNVRKWGYMDANGRVVISAKYYYASEFTEDGYAFVTDLSGFVRMIDRNGNVVLNPYGPVTYPAHRENRATLTAFVLPEAYDITSLGFFRFSCGYTRVRSQTYDYYYIDTPLTTKDMLVDKDGNYFPIPDGYTLCAYSDGILLLEKDGLYGYYSVTERWIVPPYYTYAEPFVDGLAALGFSNGKKGMINTEGEFVLPLVYDAISQASSGVVTAYESAHGWLIYHIMASTVSN